MPLRAQPNFPGTTQLVEQCAYYDDPCFYVDKDYLYYLDLLEKYANEFRCHIHAYVLMPGQVFLLATPHTDQGVSLMMQSLNREYAKYIAQTYDRVDTLWKAYHASLLQAETQLVDAMAFILQSPQRTQLGLAADYPWSSLSDSQIITPHAVWLADIDKHQHQLLQRLDSSRCQQMLDALETGQALGDEAFVESIEQQLSRQKQKQEETCVSCVMVY